MSSDFAEQSSLSRNTRDTFVYPKSSVQAAAFHHVGWNVSEPGYRPALVDSAEYVESADPPIAEYVTSKPRR